MLTDKVIQTAKPKEKNYILKDYNGLYLEITTKGKKRWRIRYWIQKKENRLSLGKYPEITLKQARERCNTMRIQIANGIDPSLVRKKEKEQKTISTITFEKVAREWFNKFKTKWTKETSKSFIQIFEANLFPYLCNKNIKDITPHDMIVIINRMEDRQAFATARRALSNASRVFRYAIIKGIVDSDPCRDLRGILVPYRTRHMATIIEPKEIGALLRAIDSLSGSIITVSAMKLAPLLFVRPRELCSAEWKDIDFDSKEWRIPAEKMKMRRQHIVPLSRQSISILQDIKCVTCHSDKDIYVFPQAKTRTRHISTASLVAAIRRMGYMKEEFTTHGFRALASTRLNEMGYNRDWIERQLAHMPSDKIRASYNYAEYLPERKKMMQEWADYLDKLKNGYI